MKAPKPERWGGRSWAIGGISLTGWTGLVASTNNPGVVATPVAAVLVLAPGVIGIIVGIAVGAYNLGRERGQ